MRETTLTEDEYYTALCEQYESDLYFFNADYLNDINQEKLI